MTTKDTLHQIVDQLAYEQAGLALALLKDLADSAHDEVDPLDAATLASLVPRLSRPLGRPREDARPIRARTRNVSYRLVVEREAEKRMSRLDRTTEHRAGPYFRIPA